MQLEQQKHIDVEFNISPMLILVEEVCASSDMMGVEQFLKAVEICTHEQMPRCFYPK